MIGVLGSYQNDVSYSLDQEAPDLERNGIANSWMQPRDILTPAATLLGLEFANSLGADQEKKQIIVNETLEASTKDENGICEACSRIGTDPS